VQETLPQAPMLLPEWWSIWSLTVQIGDWQEY